MRAAIILNCARLSSIFRRQSECSTPWQRSNSQSLTWYVAIQSLTSCGYALEPFVGSRVAHNLFDESNLT